jgi:Na+-transporting NADH:ubiquinone oxidoreductase subunit NqrD
MLNNVHDIVGGFLIMIHYLGIIVAKMLYIFAFDGDSTLLSVFCLYHISNCLESYWEVRKLSHMQQLDNT